MADLNVQIVIKGIDNASGPLKSVNQSLGRVDNDMGRINQSASKMGQGVSTAMKAVSLAAAGAAVGVAAFAVKAIGAASDLSESQNKVNEVFEEGASIINKFAKGAARDVGLSSRAALEATGTFGNLFVQLGVAKDRSADLSIEMVKLAADFASFHNADITEVILAQTAAFRGEFDALQRFTPLINAATVEQRALEMTGKKVTKELTAQEKALAVHALMLEGAGKAMGDFDRTSSGMANSMRIIRASFEDITGAIGEKLLPVVAPLIKNFAEFLPSALDRTIGFFDTLGKRIDEVRKAFAGEPIVGDIVTFEVSEDEEARAMTARLSDIQTVMKWFGEKGRWVHDGVDTIKQAFGGEWKFAEGIDPFHATLGDVVVRLNTEVFPALDTFKNKIEENAGGHKVSVDSMKSDWDGYVEELGVWKQNVTTFLDSAKQELNTFANDPWVQRAKGAYQEVEGFLKKIFGEEGLTGDQVIAQRRQNLQNFGTAFVSMKDTVVGAIREVIRWHDNANDAIDRFLAKLGISRGQQAAPAWTPPTPIFGPRPEPAPDQNQGFQTQWGQWREIPGMMNQPVSITAHGKEVIGRPPWPSAPVINITSPLVSIANMTIANDFDRDALLEEVEQAAVRGIASAWSSGNRQPHALRPRIG